MKYKLEPRTDGQANLLHALRRSLVTFVNGPAGTGKTHIAVSYAVAQLLGNDEIQKIIMCRPLVSASNEIGYLPGDLGEKCAPYLVPLFDELSYHFSPQMIEVSIDDGTIEVVPLGMMRGRNFHRCIVICDEAQNATMSELRLLLTRIGRHTKVILAGDASQTDLRDGGGGFLHMARTLGVHDLISHVTLTPADIVRSKIVADIEELLTTAQNEQSRPLPTPQDDPGIGRLPRGYCDQAASE